MLAGVLVAHCPHTFKKHHMCAPKLRLRNVTVEEVVWVCELAEGKAPPKVFVEYPSTGRGSHCFSLISIIVQGKSTQARIADRMKDSILLMICLHSRSSPEAQKRL